MYTSALSSTILENRNQNNSINISDSISMLFNSLKTISANIEQHIILQDQEDRIQSIIEEFISLEDQKGVVFAKKVLALFYQYMSYTENELNLKLQFLEKANIIIDSAVKLSKEIQYYQPSIYKRQGIIKSELADVLHQLLEHQKANDFDIEALKILGKLSHDNSEYPEGMLAYAIVETRKIYWNINKVLINLDRAEKNILNHRPKKYQINITEKACMLDQIELLRGKMTKLVEILNIN